jgi:hypothetical protein
MLSALLALILFGGMLLLLEIGRRMGVRHVTSEGEGGAPGIGAIEGSIFALLGLLIAFTFSGALTRFDTRRHLDVEEANDIGTAWLRLDLLPAEAQPALRKLFRQYVETRLEVYRKLPDLEASKREMARVTELQGEIWKQAVAASRKADTPAAAMLLLSALNAMIDITTTQTMASRIHPPVIVFVMLYVLALVSALLAGYDLARARDRHWIHILGFAAATAIAFYVVLDLEYPRLGLIRIDAFNQLLVDLLANMK